jgi:hypothetical protein
LLVAATDLNVAQSGKILKANTSERVRWAFSLVASVGRAPSHAILADGTAHDRIWKRAEGTLRWRIFRAPDCGVKGIGFRPEAASQSRTRASGRDGRR